MKEKFKHKLDIQFFADDESQEVDNQDESQEVDNQDESQDKTFTQEEVNRLMSKEKKEGRQAAYTNLGLDIKDKKMVEEVKQFILSKKSSNGDKKDVNMNSESTKEVVNINDDKIMLLEQKILIANTKTEAMKLGVRPEYVDDLVTLAMSSIEDEDDIEDAVNSLKSKYKVWFTDEALSEKDKEVKKKQGTGTSFKNNKNGKGDTTTGERLAKMRVEQIKKSSFFGGKQK